MVPNWYGCRNTYYRTIRDGIGDTDVSGKQDWETPWDLFNLLDSKYHFTLDAAANDDNAKCDRWIDEEHNALSIDDIEGEVIWCNPPYANMAPWVRQFVKWSRHNMVVCLVQDKTDTVWFKDLWDHSAIARFLHGRVNFIGTETGNMHGAVVFVLRYAWDKTSDIPEVDIWDWRAEI